MINAVKLLQAADFFFNMHFYSNIYEIFYKETVTYIILLYEKWIP